MTKLNKNEYKKITFTFYFILIDFYIKFYIVLSINE